MIRFLTSGESHGPAEVAILEGIPAGLPITKADIQADLDKRKGGYGRGGRGKIESDEVEILSGIRHGQTLGSPIALMVRNQDFANWTDRMSVGPTENTSKKETQPRPGHADLAGVLKYGFDDVRNVLERASARETIMRVAIGAVCRKLLNEVGIEIASHTVGIGSVTLESRKWKVESENKFLEIVKKIYEVDPDIRCIDKDTSEKMKEEIRQATIQKDTLGGVIEIIAIGVPIGLGSHVHWDRKLDGQLAQAFISIPSVKAVEVGQGFTGAGKKGSEIQDEIFFEEGSYTRHTNRLGGIEGGITNGEAIVCRVYHKPISTLNNPLNTVNIDTKAPEKALVERSDVCVVPRAGIISESMMAYVLSNALVEKFGGDSLSELKRNYESYQEWLKTV